MEPRWIPIKIATKYATIGKMRLKELANQGIIKGVKDPDSKRGDWIFDRLSLDKYRDSQMPILTAKDKALEILKDFRVMKRT